MGYEKIKPLLSKQEQFNPEETLEIKYDPLTNKAVEAIRRNRQGEILEYQNLKKLKKTAQKIATLKAMGFKKLEKYAYLLK